MYVTKNFVIVQEEFAIIRAVAIRLRGTIKTFYYYYSNIELVYKNNYI